MQITREDPNPCTVRLSIVCDPEEVHSGFEKATKKLVKQVQLPGFRPGNAPRHLAEQQLNPTVLLDEALQNIIGNTYRQVLKEQALEPDPTVRPQVDVSKITKDECEFTVKIGLPPVVELGDLNGIPVERPNVEVTEEDIDRQITDLRQKRGTREAITERGVTEGDVCVVEIKPDGEESGRTFMVLAGQTFADLDKALAGMRVENTKHVELTFPDAFQEQDWAGKTLACNVSLNSVSAIRLPDLDDSFAQSLKLENVDELRQRIRTGMENAIGSEIEKIVSDQLLDGLLERSKIEVSDNMWEPVAEQQEADVVREQAENGKNLETYATEQGMTVEELREDWRRRAQTEVRRALLIREIYNKEQMKLTGPDLDREIYDMAREVGVEPKELLTMLDKQNATNEIQFRAISRKVREFLAAHADVKEMAGSVRA